MASFHPILPVNLFALGGTTSPAARNARVTNTKSCDADVAIIGAGVAGLAAATTLRGQGRSVVVLEAGARVGGRAHTVRPAALGGEMVDLGASWLHMAAHNPLAKIAAQAGVCTTPFAPKTRLTALPFERPPRLLANNNDRAQAEDDFHAAFPRTPPSQDKSVLAMLQENRAANPWFATIATMEGALFSAADVADLSFADWRENELDDDNLWPHGGMGAFVSRHIADKAGPVELGWPVTEIDWDAPGGVRITGPRGGLKATSCIVTASTGVLQSGAIRFTTPLPAAHQHALALLPMGLLSKIVFPAPPELLALDADTSVEHRVEKIGDAAMFFIVRPNGAPIVIGHCGGRIAWELARAGHAAHEDFARAELAAIFGAHAPAWISPGSAIVSDWGETQLFAGAYSYGKPGCGNARDVLASPVGDGRLLFAGEACHRGMSGTVQAAWITGIAAAERAARWAI
jgi:monoamine oxidase